MCWQIDIKVNLQKDTEANRLAIQSLNLPAIQIKGEHPLYSMQRNGCACDLVKEKGLQIEGLSEAVMHYLSQPLVKSVEVRGYWISDKSESPDLVKIELEEFNHQLSGMRLEPDVVYRVYKARRY
jgi:hypothetical protein